MVVLISIELSDVVFAMDSVPAVLGISNDAVVIYASNVLAVMGLRSLYFVIADALMNLRFLSKSLACILGFIGAKMIAAAFGFDLDVVISLGVVLFFLGTGIALSLTFPVPKLHVLASSTDGMHSPDPELGVPLEHL
jgi:tellurite resistance protein TerC